MFAVTWFVFVYVPLVHWVWGGGFLGAMGLAGTLLCGVFATASIGGTAGLIEGHPQQVLIRLYGVAVILVWSAGATRALLKLVSVFVPPRVSKETGEGTGDGRPRHYPARRSTALISAP